ncbi:MAG TPA: DEAD/DEAH box helicase family protein [Methanospirillum hungatei]|nr:DEAD/DEAH box helicase family protein [Methanospirillum hungatei]
MQAVRNIISDARENGPGQNYLIQHSAGSGKSNTIGWLAHRLVSLHNDEDIKVFDSVVVVTDRVVLDRQLQDTIYQFEHKTGVVQKIDKDSTQLASSLEKGTPIIITTLQKFPVVTQKIGDLPKRTYAVIIDEAHSSQSGESAIELKGVLAKPYVREKALQYMEEHNVPDSEDLIIAALERGYQPNISFFAFTATPKYKTLCAFGRTGPDGKPEPFHLYSMRQAIDEQFILDVLAHYTTYKTYYKLVKSIEDDPEVDRKKAAKALARFMALHPVNISQKTEVMVEHYQRHVMHKIGGRAKAMVVSDSRLAAVRYKQAFDHYIAEHQYPIKTLVAFSGEVTDKDLRGVSYTEVQMNGGIREKELPERFASDEYQILIVAEKYQTGFDQPLLHTMYLDKRVAGVQAVQTLSRLNRVATGKEDTFVLDFINTSDEIKEAFQPFYEVTLIQDKADEGQLNDLRSRLLDYQIFYTQEIEEYSRIFFKNIQKQNSSDHAILNSMISQGKARYDERPENERDEFKKILGSYLRLYSFMSQVLPYPDLDLEKLYAFGRAFANAIRSKTPGEKYRFDDDVALKYYRLQKLHENFQIELDKSGGGTVKGPTDVGTGVKKGDRSPLSKIIEILNERFGTEFTEADQLFFDSIQKDAASNEKLKQAAQANDKNKFGFALRDELKKIISGRMESNEKIVNKFFESEEFKEQVTKYMIDKVYEEIMAGE